MARSDYQYKHRRPQGRHFHIAWLFAAVLVLAAVITPLMEARKLTVEEHVVNIPDLPANLKNIRIVYASDFHWGSFMNDERLHETVNAINSQNADIVILGGDYAANAEQSLEFFEKLPPVQARLGVFGVLGDADRAEEGESADLLIARMNQAGVLPLVNALSRVKIGQSTLVIAGLDDPLKGLPDADRVAGILSSSDVVIAAGHSPDLLSQMIKAHSSDGSTHWFDVALFGHTHGGQLTMFGRSFMPGLTPALGTRYLNGWLQENRSAILVSNGVGCVGLPMRLLAAPQIHLIILKGL